MPRLHAKGSRFGGRLSRRLLAIVLMSGLSLPLPAVAEQYDAPVAVVPPSPVGGATGMRIGPDGELLELYQAT